jgi:hypothetical protein
MQQPLMTVARGTFRAKATNGRVVCRDRAAWQQLWEEHMADDDRSSPPTIDFSTRAAIGVFVGNRPSSGWTVEITSAETSDGGGSRGARLTVSYEIRPPIGLAQDVLTNPFHIVSLPRAGWDTASFVQSR